MKLARILALPALLALSACGGAALEVACNAQCDAQSQATGCTGLDPNYAQSCKTLCAAVVGSLAESCKEKAQASYDCGKAASWACLEGGNSPQLKDGACQAELTAYAMCFAS